MSVVFDIEQNKKRIRYEAFASFSTELNKCSSFENIALILRTHIKFILDSNFFRIFFKYDQHKICFDLFRGECTFSNNSESNLLIFEEQALLHNLPVTYNKNEINAHPFLTASIYNHPKIGVLALFPASYANQYQILITNGSQQVDLSIGADFKFLRLISDLLGNKLSQIFLKGLIENKNQELEFKNNEITFLNHTLEERVKQRTADLNEANQELQTIFYRTTHDFRAPLTNISGLTDLAAMLTTDNEILDLFEKCKTVIGGLDKMLYKLTVISAFASAKKVEPIDFKVLIRKVKDKFKSDLDIKQAAVQLFGYPIKGFMCDQAMLLCIFENLLENSLCYSRELPVIKITLRQLETVLLIDFEDNGTGIELAAQDKIFDMYYRGSNRSQGHGLGLYTVRKVLKILNGTIKMTSELNVSTTFHIELPITCSTNF